MRTHGQWPNWAISRIRLAQMVFHAHWGDQVMPRPLVHRELRLCCPVVGAQDLDHVVDLPGRDPAPGADLPCQEHESTMSNGSNGRYPARAKWWKVEA